MPNIYTVITYSLPELKLLAPDVFERLHRKYRERMERNWDNPWATDYHKATDAIMEKFAHWEDSELGDNRWTTPKRWTRKGRSQFAYILNKRMAYLENHVFKWLRIEPIHGLFTRRDWTHGSVTKSINQRRYYRPWTIPSCPFTGVLCDNEMLKEATELFLAGRNIRSIGWALDKMIEKYNEDDFEQACSEGEFLICNENSQFTIEGKEV